MTSLTSRDFESEGQDLDQLITECTLDEADISSKGANLQKAATKLLLLCADGKVDKVAELLDTVPATTTNEMGYTGLHEAAANGHVEVLRLLLRKGADINVKDKYGFSALHEAAHWGIAGNFIIVL
jgi:ankyrin repeat protein